jgi:hypothetical protein
LKDSFPICHDIVIVESKHAVASGFQICVASRVTSLVLRFEMLRTIDLDDHTCVMTDEVDDEGTDRCLSSKACAIKAMSAYAVPDDPLGVGEISPQRARADAQFGGDTPGRSL